MSCEESIYLEEKDVSNEYVSIASSPNILKSTSIQSNDVEIIKIGQKLDNPYSVNNMKKAYVELRKRKGNLKSSISTISPNFLYIRILPNTENDINLDLFDYPLDYEVLSEGGCHDSSVPEGNITWQYTKVEKDFNFSKLNGIKYEILEECYIPDENDLKAGSELDELEQISFELLGYKDANEETNTLTTRGIFSRYKPKGTLKVLDNKTNSYVGVKGVEVICTTFLRWGKGYTDENGNYEVQRKFMIGPLYTVKFKNHTYGFKVWGLSGPIIGSAVYLMGFHNKKGYNRSFTDRATAWKWATVNNAAYEYFQGKYFPNSSRESNNFCSSAGKGLRLMVIPFSNVGAAPLIRKIDKHLGVNSHSSWNNFFINTLLGIPANLLVSLTKKIQPDVIIGTSSKSSERISELVFHELAHHDHFLLAGDSYWANYVNYIITYGSYGNGSGKNAEYCAIGEMWGYALGTYLVRRKYNMHIYDSRGSAYWFKPNRLYFLMDEKIYPLGIMYMSLSGVNNIQDFKNNLKYYVRNRKKQIDNAFDGIRPEEPLDLSKYLKVGFVPPCP